MAIQQSSTQRAIPAIAQSAGKVAAKLIRVANRLEARALESPSLAFIPLPGRKYAFALIKCTIVISAASFAISAAMVLLGLFVLAALPTSTPSDLPTVDDVSHPEHRFYHPERYDDYGSLK